MKTVQQILVCALLAALTALAVSTAYVARAIPGEIRAARAPQPARYRQPARH